MKPFLSAAKKPALFLMSALLLTSCGDARVPGVRDVSVPAPRNAEERRAAVNERAEAITYLPLGSDVLIPEADSGSPLPSTVVGPFELRGETLGSALQLVLDGTGIPVAFETDAGLSRTVTVTDLKGPLDTVVQQICGVADLYCSYQSGILVVKDNQVFTVTIPPVVAADQVSALLTSVSAAIGNIVGTAPITDPSTRTIVYRASQRTAEMAERYFQRLRMSTALVVFETYVWEVSLDAGNATGIRWDAFSHFGKYTVGLNLPGVVDPSFGAPVSIGLPTLSGNINFSTSDVVQFISNYGAVKTVSQPQLTVLSGSSARLRVADTQNYVASISRTTTDGGNTTVSTSTDSVDSGFTLEIGSNWDNASVYTSINILLQEVRGIDTFDDNPDAVVQLPQTTERELQTQVRIRPGDSLLIAGLVRENDAFNKSGPGLAEPILPSSRSGSTLNSELVFLIRPRVIVYTTEGSPGSRPGAMTTVQSAMPQAPVSVPAPVSAPVEPAPVEPLPPVSSEPAAPLLPEPVAAQQPAQAVQPLPVPVASAPAPYVPPAPDPVPDVEVTPAGSATADPSVIIDYNVLQGN